MNLIDYSKPINFIKNYLISQVNPISIFIHGSFVEKIIFNNKYSDIDIIAVVDDLSENKAREIIKNINLDKYNNIDKHPIYLNDCVAKRIEFYIKEHNIVFDITILDNSWQDCDLFGNVCYDSLEILLGIYNRYNILLYGEYPRKLVHIDYQDELINRRLKILNDRLKRYTIRLDSYIESNDENMFDFAFRVRSFFIKYLFIYYRKYPINLNKHLFYQFEKILNLDCIEINILLLKKGSLKTQIALLNSLVKKYLR